MQAEDVSAFMDDAERLLRAHRLKPRGAAGTPGRYEVLFIRRRQAERAAEVLAPIVAEPAVWQQGHFWRAGGPVAPAEA